MTSRTGTTPRFFTRRRLLTTAGLAGLGLATGCANRFEPVRGSVPAKYRDRLRVVLWHSYADLYGQTLNKLVDGFNEAQQEIYVESQFHGTYEETLQKIVAALLAKRIPDLVTVVEFGWRKLYLDQVLEPLDDYFDAEFTPSVYQENFYQEGVKKGHSWWVPLARSTPLFYFNRTLFERLGLPERAPVTWDEWDDWMDQLNGVQINGTRVRREAYKQTEPSWPFQASVWQWGGRLSDGLEIRVNHPPAVAAGEWQRKLIIDGEAYMAELPMEDFSSQLTATLQESAAALGTIRKAADKGGWEVGTGFLPKKVDRGVPTGGGGLSILGDSTKARKQAAFELVKYLARPDNAAYWSEQTGYLPVVRKAVDEPRLAKVIENDPNYAVAVDQMELGRKPDEIWCTVPNAFSVLGSGLERMWSARTPAKQVLDDVATKWERMLDRTGPMIRRME